MSLIVNKPVKISASLVNNRRRGQSDLHRELTHRARGWLANRATGKGVRGAFEVWLAPQYVADTVVLLSLQNRYYHDCLSLRPIYSTAGLTKPEIESKLAERPENDFIIIVESKVSRSDFAASFREWNEQNPRYQPQGHLHFVITPRGLITLDEIPNSWGLLEAYGVGASLKRWPKYIKQDNEWYWRVASRVLWSGLVYEHAKHECCPDCGVPLLRQEELF